jgi:hypothetical protein
LVVLVLVVVWVAVLTPRLIRHFKDGRSGSSIESFHQQLHLLERTGPKLVEPAYRLEVPESAAHLSLFDEGPAAHPTPQLVRGVRRRQASAERRRTRRRRRDLLLGLVGIAAVTGGLGAMHALHLLWAVTGVSALAIAGYLALVAYAQVLHADRDAARPVAPRLPDAPVAPWSRTRPRHAPASATSAVELITVGSHGAARAGYPGAWDDDELVATPRHAASGG